MQKEIEAAIKEALVIKNPQDVGLVVDKIMKVVGEKQTAEKTFTAKQIMEKLESVCPNLKDKKKFNPFLYESIEQWYNDLT